MCARLIRDSTDLFMAEYPGPGMGLKDYEILVCSCVGTRNLRLSRYRPWDTKPWWPICLTTCWRIVKYLPNTCSAKVLH